jgi:hypothetical protein
MSENCLWPEFDKPISLKKYIAVGSLETKEIFMHIEDQYCFVIIVFINNRNEVES